MAQHTIVTMVDDLDGTHGDDTNPVTAVDFALDGQGYEIDLTAANAGELRNFLAAFIAHARKATTTTKRAAPASSGKVTPRPSVDREQNQAIRDWARRSGAAISDRGRIPAEVVDAYHKGGDAAATALQEYITRQHARLAAQMPASANGQTAAPAQEQEPAPV